jgi:alpha-L-fucosidase
MYSYREGFPEPAFKDSMLYQPFTKEAWAASNFATEDDLQWFRDARYGMFIHFGLSTFAKSDLSWGVCRTRKAPDVGSGPIADEVWQSWPQEFRLEKFDATEWVRIAQEANFKYIVLITKHHDGFHMWDTAESDFKITNTPFGRDLVKEVVDACHAAGMPIGLYYSQRDWYHPDYMPVDLEKVTRKDLWWTLKPGYDSPAGERHAKYIEYQERVVRELCTKYGKIDVFWWDAFCLGNMFTAEMWEGERMTRLIRELQPGIIINNRCSVPGDFDTPEERLGAFQNWRPWESCICLTSSWSYSATPPKTLKQLVNMFTNNVCGDGNLLLSWGPHWDGEFDAAEKARLVEFGSWLKTREHTLFGTRGGPWICNSWGGSVHRGSTVHLHVTNLPGGILDLPKISSRTVLSAHYLGGGAVQMEEFGESLRLTIPPDRMDEMDTIIVVQFDRTLDGIDAVATGRQTIFTDTTTYGQPVGDVVAVTASSVDEKSDNLALLIKEDANPRIATKSQANAWIQLDLGSQRMVTGVRVEYYANQRKRMTVRALASVDGQEWTDCGEIEQPFGEVSVNGYHAGALIPGKPTRYVKIQVTSDRAVNLELKHCTVFARRPHANWQ